MVRTAPGVWASHTAALPHGGKSGIRFEKKAEREKCGGAASRSGDRRSEGRQADKRDLTCCVIGQTGVT